MGKKVLVDGRWDGDTGIGKLYREVMSRKPEGVDLSFIDSEMGLGSLFSPWMLGKRTKTSDADVLYSPSYMPPLLANKPFVITIHDLMHMFYYTKLHRMYYQQVIAPLAKKAKEIITVSEYSKRQLVSLLGIPEKLISVIYNGVDEGFAMNTEELDIGRPYFLYIGNRRRNKNLPAMLRAFAKSKIPRDYVFAITGSPDPSVQKLIDELKIGHRVHFLGFIKNEDLPKLYKGAFATMYVSLMEGFGLPLLESMASGTPVLTSSTSSLPEVAGGAALCIDPEDIDEIGAGMARLVWDDTLYRGLVSAGEKRHQLFSWEDTASQTWATILR